ncbi:MAG: hypothetical protein PHO89_09580 [Methylacidiphilaceae bacterium]|nr:hypothetical protein [Candidatus Methylacidiphilaceae bacterium]
MEPKDWDDLCRLLVEAAAKTGEIELARELICKLATIDTHARIDAAGYKGALDLLASRKFYRVSEAKRILAEAI